MTLALPVLPAREVFDVAAPLPRGTTVLEASAGTGKTFTIAALAVRFVAEGHATLPELMLVTFGREATRELRDRVRERFVDVAAGLADPEAARAGDDRVLALLAAGSDTAVGERRRRLTHALAHFDAATIATTHQFCSRMLDGLGIVGDTDPGAVFTEDVDDLVTEVVDDFYVRKYADPRAGRPEFTRAEALAIGRRAVGDPEARLTPESGAGPAAVRRAFADAVRGELERRKRVRRLYTYDDMLTRLDRALRDGPLRETARARLRARYRVVLVDEFQDTDPLQWAILRAAFHGTTTLTFIGDPKQAIYAFRGADVVSYLDAAEHAGTQATLRVNWRSDAALVAALDTVIGGAALGDERILVGEVQARHVEGRLSGAPVDAPFRLRVVPRAGLPATERGIPRVDGVRARVAADLAVDVVALLASGARWDGRPLAAGDVAVLVRTNAQGTLVHDALARAGVPAVLGGTTSVFATPSAREWLVLLEALEQPHRAGRVRAAALTCFLGRRAVELDTDGDRLLDEYGALLRRWAVVLRERGVAALLEVVAARTDLAARLLAAADGERRLTDVRHVGESLHAAAVGHHLGLVALAEWLRRRIAEAGREQRPERSRRLESDADAVQILTVHRGKGLEFPVVHVPFGWDRNVNDPDLALHHDDHGRRVLAVGGEADPEWAAHVEAHQREEAGEDLRLLYVALTRAQSQVVAWWAPSTTTRCSPLHRLLFGRPEAGWAGTEPRSGYRVPDDAAALDYLRALAGPGSLVVEAVDPGVDPPRHAPTRPDAGPLAAARFTRTLDLSWRRTSYSALTAAAHGPVVGSEPEVATTDDEADVGPVVVGAAEALEDLPSPMADLPVGTGFGTLVHAVLETADPTAPDLLGELTGRAADALRRRPTAGLAPETLAEALVPVLRTPLGPEPDAWRLCDVEPADRLAEMDFELPLAGGDTPGATVSLGDVEVLLRRHLPATDPLHTYPDALAAIGAQPLRGYLTGSVDAVLRDGGRGERSDGDGDGRYVVVDYKTNWLGPVGPAGPEPLTAAHYRPDALRAAMVAAHYPLQALLYSVALHRFLRWRLRGYDPARHLGGSLYLFLRGMCGPDTPVADGGRCGVFAWRPPAALVVELSDVLDRGAS